MNKTIQKLLFTALAAVLSAGLLLGGCSPVPEEDHDHEHDDQLYEWSAIYELPADIYSLEFLESPHDSSIMIAFLSEGPAQEDLEHMALHIMGAPGEEVAAGDSFHAEDQYAYNLQLNNTRRPA
ncbi:MAG: hypothetical protein Q7J85_08200 [Bacillota bacterium]|nr:hypothetical protein [Bacillota bacterium]